MLIFSKIADSLGRKRIFIIAIIVYTIGLLVASLSQGIVQLIFARAIQGASGATISALSLAITVATFPGEERGKALGVLIGTSSVGLVAGPALGGIILDFLSWQAIFYTRIPFMAAAFVMAWFILFEQKKSDDRHFRFDTFGALTLFSWIACLLLLLSFGNKWGATAIPTIVLGILTVLFFAGFLISERRSLDPIVDLRLFKKRVFASATFTCMIVTVGTTSAAFLVPFYLMDGFGYSGTEVGIYLAMLALPSIILSPISGRLSDKIGSGILSTIGVILSCLGLFCLIQLGKEATFITISVSLALVGSGIGIFHPPNNSALVGAVSKDMLGVASGIGTASRNIGSSISIALSGALYSNYHSYYMYRFQQDGLDLHIAERMATISSFRDTLIVLLVIASFAILISIFRGRAKDLYEG
jgi:EmrB/QacA subfamily drug resistance transporter